MHYCSVLFWKYRQQQAAKKEADEAAARQIKSLKLETAQETGKTRGVARYANWSNQLIGGFHRLTFSCIFLAVILSIIF